MVTPQRHHNVPRLKKCSNKINLINGMTKMKCNVISIDLAKNIFQICALDGVRQALFNKNAKR